MLGRLQTAMGGLRGRALPRACIAAACLGAAGASLAQPAEPATAALRLSGFGTFGASRTSAPPTWGFQRETIQPPNEGGVRFDTDSRLGLQANYALDPRVELTGQLLLTRRMGAAVPSDALEWAVAAYRPTDTLTLRAGRINGGPYLLSDYRSVGLAFPFVRPPVEFYGLLPGTFDGVDASQSWRDDADAVWTLRGFYGRTKQGDNRTSSFRTFRPTYGLVFAREEHGLLVKGSFARAKITDSTPRVAPLIQALQAVGSLPVSEVASDAARLQSQLALQGRAIDYVGLGLNIDRDDWLGMLELSHARVRGFNRIAVGYALLGHRFGKFTPYIALSEGRGAVEGQRPVWTAALTPVIGPALAVQAQALGDLAYDATSLLPKQRSTSLGLRCDITAQAALKLQFDRIRIGEHGSLLWVNGGNQPASAHVLSATLDFIF